jgi:hypothetical protein
MKPSNEEIWLRTAPLLVLAEDLESYREHCEEMLARFGQSDEATVVERTSKACMLLPGVVSASQRPLATLQNALEDGSAPKWFAKFGYATLALAAYRADDPNAAIQYIRKAQQSDEYANTDTVQAIVLCLLAMSQHKLAEPEKAGQTLARASRLIDVGLEKVAGGQVGGWHDWLIAEVLRREAKESIAVSGNHPPSKADFESNAGRE